MRCTWCRQAIDSEDDYRLGEARGGRGAAFCRLEHVVPWAIRGARWEQGDVGEPGEPTEGMNRCAHCGASLAELHLLLVRHRGGHRIPDRFCSVDHLAAWAKAGGRWSQVAP